MRLVELWRVWRLSRSGRFLERLHVGSEETARAFLEGRRSAGNLNAELFRDASLLAGKVSDGEREALRRTARTKGRKP